MRSITTYTLKSAFLIVLLSAMACSKDGGGTSVRKTAYIDKVYDFLPAPGQFINTMPAYVQGDTRVTMTAKAESLIKGSKPKGMVSLGGFGGYIVFGFDHIIENKTGYRDFRILGNAIWSVDNPNPEASPRGGSCEPGVIMVSYDVNGNGLPDDEWYEIKGSEYDSSLDDYEITYYKPDPSKEPVLDPQRPYLSDMEYIYWEDNRQNSGYITKNKSYLHSYYPEWEEGSELTLSGRCLPGNAVDEGEAVPYWVLYSFAYGYADNAPNNDAESAIDIAWAVDATGTPANLPGINFVKVYSGLNQQSGEIGETSTEISGAYDLHMLGIKIPTR